MANTMTMERLSPQVGKSSSQTHERTWAEWATQKFSAVSETVTDAFKNPYIEMVAAGVATTAVVAIGVASRGKLIGLSEKLFPKASDLLGDLKATSSLEEAGNLKRTGEVEQGALPKTQIFPDGSSRNITQPTTFTPVDPELILQHKIRMRNGAAISFAKEWKYDPAETKLDLDDKWNLTSRLAYRRPVLDLHVNGPANVLEIGSHDDITVPKVLGDRLKTYVSVDPADLNPEISDLWRRRLAHHGLSTENKWRVAGFDNQLPIAPNSQDIVYRNCITHGLPTTLNFDEQFFLKAMTEAHKVLRPGGKLLVGPWSYESDVVLPQLAKIFNKIEMHFPNEAELRTIKDNEDEPSVFEWLTQTGYIRTFVGTK